MAPTSPFKVIVVGGGPADLTAAHTLYKATIDFVVLERRQEVVIDEGASLVLGVDTLRIMHQLGLLDKLKAISSELLILEKYTVDSTQFTTLRHFESMRPSFGSGPRTFHRAELIRTLYDELPPSAKAKVLTAKGVTEIESDENGVCVTCADGSVYAGSIVMGADSAHSKTRRLMADLSQGPNMAKSPYTINYRCFWCSFPKQTPISDISTETQDQDRSVMYLTGTERSAEEADAFATQFFDFPIMRSLKVGDVVRQSFTKGMADIEEGIVKHWSWGRVVLVGDACHKFTPNAGLGLNNGVQGIVVLLNELRRTIEAVSDGQPSLEKLTKAFQKYRVLQMKPRQANATRSAQTIGVQTWANWGYYIFGRYLMQSKPLQWLFNRFLIPKSIQESRVLDYVRTNECFTGTIYLDAPTECVDLA
ncbi:FAD binding domain-containing protein [Tilletiaria anomala UBC 951]|uniref:FAD binding domain-containing protein n=1 Tax=Tilletiaria anomala (strain ATCC 24038 / CBS 436.72 / UBC 951) TaxID=1037660 RepID=A0A066W4V4_TILAU|nr:FAD binding domain-containing protein [Tilletiaria anomala UBC 951]KDN46109.1 FAD binding domain-containing protein [Tilletiaria anomala UBC 951]